ncbi:DUF6520 family protein [Flavobacterium sp.]|uniref:DUF6520 family protein n=1 Tax=Flavobacterium sp. TaxID=239 RepID=UPI0031E1F7BD
MKTNLKKMIPMAVAVLGIAGAFVTTSMQKASSTLIPRLGYVLDENDDCNIPVQCDTNQNEICQHTDGQQAFGKDAQGNCNVTLFKPSN